MFDIANVRKVHDNLAFEEQQAMKEFRSICTDVAYRTKAIVTFFQIMLWIQIKLKNRWTKVLEYDISESTCIDIQNWLEKWKKWGLSDEWIKFVTSNEVPHPGTSYPLIKTHKPSNPAWVITSGCGTPTENL